jgi:formate hydrogenlyase subunit 6/NADH:ubiquinone oxidoreductase subunit I
MKLGAMLSDVLDGLVRTPATERYPFERKAAPERLRGKLLWQRDSCTGCGLCAKDCPANALDVIVIDRKAKQFVFHYDVDRCLFCGQCVHSCRQGCLEMDSDQWELAALERGGYAEYYGDAADVQSVLAARLEDGAADEDSA